MKKGQKQLNLLTVGLLRGLTVQPATKQTKAVDQIRTESMDLE